MGGREGEPVPTTGAGGEPKISSNKRVGREGSPRPRRPSSATSLAAGATQASAPSVRVSAPQRDKSVFKPLGCRLCFGSTATAAAAAATTTAAAAAAACRRRLRRRRRRRRRRRHYHCPRRLRQHRWKRWGWSHTPRPRSAPAGCAARSGPQQSRPRQSLGSAGGTHCQSAADSVDRVEARRSRCGSKSTSNCNCRTLSQLGHVLWRECVRRGGAPKLEPPFRLFRSSSCKTDAHPAELQQPTRTSTFPKVSRAQILIARRNLVKPYVRSSVRGHLPLYIGWYTRGWRSHPLTVLLILSYSLYQWLGSEANLYFSIGA